MSESDSDLNDGAEDLEDIMGEYDTKSKETSENQNILDTDLKNDNKTMDANVRLEVPMDRVIFGDKESLLKNMAKAVEEGDEDATSENDEEGLTGQRDVKDSRHVNGKSDEKFRDKAKKRKPVWFDEDDEKILVSERKRETKKLNPLDYIRADKTYKEYLTGRFTRIVPQPKWANLDHKNKTFDDSDDEELLHTVGYLAKTAAVSLPPTNIQYKQLKDLNRATYAEGPISSVCFHPHSTAALVCGFAGIATIYSIDGTKNEKLHNIRFHDYPIRCARITPCGTKAIFGSIHRFFYSYDLLGAREMRHRMPKNVTTLRKFEISTCGRYIASAGRFGEMHLFDAASKEIIHSYKQEEEVAGLCFTGDSQRIICSSRSSAVNIFSIRMQRLEHSFIDDGCISGQALDLSPNGRLLATGSREGIVNVYDFDKVFTKNTPNPEKTITNLRTAISDVKFNHSSEVLAMSSGEVDSATKLIHFPTGSVFSNFPPQSTNFGKISTVQFSPTSGYLAMGNRKKEVTLFRLKHFNNY